jgi:hypothetical protein
MSLLCMTALSTDRSTALPKANSAFPVRAPGPHIVLDVDVEVPEDDESVPSEEMEYVGGIGDFTALTVIAHLIRNPRNTASLWPRNWGAKEKARHVRHLTAAGPVGAGRPSTLLRGQGRPVTVTRESVLNYKP